MKTTVSIMLILFSVFAITIIEYQQSHYSELTRERVYQTAERDLLVIRSNLEANIYSDIFYANSLATLVSVNPDSSVKQWETIAKELFRKSHHLRNIALAPDDIIQFVHPYKENKAAIGLDFKTIPGQWEMVKKARDLQSIFLAGPVNLVQGGVGLIARNPIFTDPPVNSEYWGTCSVVIDMDSLFRYAGINQFSQRYDFAIRGKDGEGSEGEVFWGEVSVFESDYVSEPVVLPSGLWEMGISVASLYTDIPWYMHQAPRLIGYSILLFLLIIFVFVYYMYSIVHEHSIHDELTRLPNRRYFMYTLEQMIEDVHKKGTGLALLNLDLDKFKSINDTYGHLVGDKVLIAVARKIKKVLRASDIVARVGGDEFLIILPRIFDESDVQRITDALHKEIDEKPLQIGADRIYIEISIGYSIYSDESVTMDELLKMADDSMYELKKRNAESSEAEK